MLGTIRANPGIISSWKNCAPIPVGGIFRLDWMPGGCARRHTDGRAKIHGRIIGPEGIPVGVQQKADDEAIPARRVGPIYQACIIWV